jgi:hypothetical protein
VNDESGESQLVHRHTVWVVLCCVYVTLQQLGCCAAIVVRVTMT